MKLSYFGHSAFGFTTDSGTRLLIDPYLDDNPLCPVKANQVEAEYIVITHAHSDHLGDTLKIARSDTTVICVAELAGYLREKKLKTHAMQIGGEHSFDFGSLRLVSALHGSMTPDGRYAGLAAGAIITMDGICLYHMGDTGIFGDLKLIGERHKIDCLLIPIGGNYTMDPVDAALAASWIKPELAIPMHFNTFPLIKQDPTRFAELCKKHGIKTKIMEPGVELSL